MGEQNNQKKNKQVASCVTPWTRCRCCETPAHSQRRRRPRHFSIPFESTNVKVGRAGRLRAESFAPFSGWRKGNKLGEIHLAWLCFRINFSSFLSLPLRPFSCTACSSDRTACHSGLDKQFKTSLTSLDQFNKLIMAITRETSQAHLVCLLVEFTWSSIAKASCKQFYGIFMSNIQIRIHVINEKSFFCVASKNIFFQILSREFWQELQLMCFTPSSETPAKHNGNLLKI